MYMASPWERGSSPHTRGAPGSLANSAGSSWDHPRIRGEHRSSTVFGSPSHGSSPHTRGARAGSSCASQMQRIIPAYAGSTRRPASATGYAPDHPRIRGEHRNFKFPAMARIGSSPHTRGAPHRPLMMLLPTWIIPAYAGSTTPPGLSARVLRDHPRIRGEHWSASWLAAVPPGSSPHTRGAPRTGLGCARRGADHPRIRGEHKARGVWPVGADGSSPHTRGARYRISRLDPARRIIPAYAGSTPKACPRTPTSPDHPRIRGEHDDSDQYSIDGLGSSPHTRGAQPPHRRR